MRHLLVRRGHRQGPRYRVCCLSRSTRSITLPNRWARIDAYSAKGYHRDGTSRAKMLLQGTNILVAMMGSAHDAAGYFGQFGAHFAINP